jgi:hypothetical protein
MRKPSRHRILAALVALGFSTIAGARNEVDGELLQKYCIDCHDQENWKGGLALDYVDLADVGAEAEMWERVVLKMRTGMMPPAGEPRPSEAILDRFSSHLEQRLDRVAKAHPQPGAPGLRRMTRFEYGNVIRDLLAVEIDATSMLPPDNNSDGFDSNGDTLGNSPALVEAYVNAASKIARRAVGDRHAPVAQVDHRPPVGWTQERHIEGLPLGTRGGFVAKHEFPVDGEYEFVIATASGTLFGSALPQGSEVYVAIDGAPVKAENLRKFRYRVAAGRHAVAVGVVERVRGRGTDDIYSIDRQLGAISGLTVTGPFAASGAGDTPSRRQVFICRPTELSAEEGCARRILARLATRAYRQPLAADDPAVESLLGFYRDGRRRGDFDDGLEQALARVLINPRFLFRLEPKPQGVKPGEVYRLPDLELASRLSFFLWSSIPDDELLRVAASGKLHEPRELQTQVRRMLADARSRALVDNFASQWLRLRALDSIPADEQGFDENLRQALHLETRLLIESVVRADRPVTALLDSQYTFVDEQLARHYGLPGVQGSYMRKVPLASGNVRRGLLGQGSILTLTSLPDRTSPVVRGKWVMENLIGAHVPSPPAGVETNLEPPAGHENPMTLRQRLEAHRVQPDCAACHRIMDPLGFALENFDRTGKWRTQDSGLPVDSAGELTDGTPLDGPESLRSWLLAHPDVFASNLASKLLIYGLGRSIDHRDMPVVRDVVRNSASSGYRFSQLILGIVMSEPFRYRMAAPIREAS